MQQRAAQVEGGGAHIRTAQIDTDHKIARWMDSLVEIFSEVVCEHQIVAPSATIYDDSGRVVADFPDGLPAQVVDEMEFYIERYQAKNFDLYDLTAIIKKDWIMAFAQEILRRGGPGTGASVARAIRIPPGHPEGFLEAFAQLYKDLGEQITAKQEGRSPDPQSLLVPGIAEGVEGMRFISAVLESSRNRSAWTALSGSQ